MTARTTIRRRAALPALLVLLATAACAEGNEPFAPDPLLPSAGAGADEGGRALGVMTRNVYIGADIGPLFALDFNDPVAVITTAATIWGQIQATDFAERASSLANEIAEHRPDVVGLQEIFHFAILDGAFQPIGVQDNLAALEAEIAARGLDYTTVAVQAGTSTALPVAFNPATGQVTQWVQVTDRIATLVRNGVEVARAETGQYAAGFPLAPGLELRRGWVRVDVEHRGTTYHHVNTHLEGQALAPVQAAQLAELLDGVLTGLEGVTILAGDLNSDAEAGPGAPSWTPTYDALIDAGFVDAWAQASRSSRAAGSTCCHAPDLLNAAPTLDERIDFILMRASDAHGVGTRLPGAVHAEIVGDEIWNRTASGLWPSDHAGVMAQIRLAGGLFAN